MSRYARIQDGRVAEIIEPFERTQYPAPAPLPAGYEPTESEAREREEAQTLHDAFVPGFVPIEERFSPALAAACVPVPEGAAVAEGQRFDGTSFLPPPPPRLPTSEENVARRDAALAAAAVRMAPLQDAVDLDQATAAESALLSAWKQHRVALNRLGMSAGQLPWPPSPED